MNPKVDAFIRHEERWQAEFEQLRAIVLDCGLAEDFKWRHPCYTFEDSNIAIIQGFKAYCALLFVKGVLLKDTMGILVQMTENVQSSRQLRFTAADEIEEMAPIIKAYILEAIEVEKAGLEVDYKETSEFDIPEEFQRKLDADPALKAAFEALTPGRQRGYLLHFSQAKQSKTRASRVEKCTPKILAGKGLNDR
jgi:uncharacterized protein YdeI (YjbR/CyaY-like superfamily)